MIPNRLPLYLDENENIASALRYVQPGGNLSLPTALILDDLAQWRGWDTVRTVIDIGGGHGQLALAMLARVFAGEPTLLLADEPVAALDPYHQLHVMELEEVFQDR